MSLVTEAQTVTLYQVGDMIINGSFNNLLDALDGSYCTFEGGNDATQDAIYPDEAQGGYTGPSCGVISKPAHIISTSFSQDEAQASAFYNIRQCHEYAKFGLMGVTMIYSSGDNGVAGYAGACLNSNNSIVASNGTGFSPSFPSTCPYVTSVGATQINPGATVWDDESACSTVIQSGGGFSNMFAVPRWQESAVRHYMRRYAPDYPEGTYNDTGLSRGFPDLAANGAHYNVAIDGNFTKVYGTSASTPVVAAILAMVNDARISNDQRPIGFINPTIYSSRFADAFNDITTGNNAGCGTNGFDAAPGWDPVTGLGTPNFERLVEEWLRLP